MMEFKIEILGSSKVESTLTANLVTDDIDGSN